MNNNIWQIREEKKICCLDIDGVLNDYPKCWVDYINSSTENNFKDLNEAKATIAYDKYRKLKEKYRTSGVKETLAANPQASRVTKALKGLEYSIVLMTARPAHEYPTLYTQTMNWLKNNEIEHDYIFFEERNKHSKILSEVPHMKFMVEDNSYNANQISKWGYKVFLMETQYNKGLKLGRNVTSINKLEKVLEGLK